MNIILTTIVILVLIYMIYKARNPISYAIGEILGVIIEVIAAIFSGLN